MIDNVLLFSSQQAIANGTAVNSTNVLNAGTPFGGIGTAVAPKLAEGDGFEVVFEVTAAGNSTNDDWEFTAKVVGSAAAGLTSPTVLGTVSSGVKTATQLATAGTLPLVYTVKCQGQAAALQYYGVIYDLAGTAPTCTVNAYVRGFGEHQTNLAR